MPYRTYDVAEICLNGHIITDRYSRKLDQKQDFCEKCGQPAITACTNCYAPIRGKCINPETTSPGHTYKAPHFCRGCGEMFPWTAATIKAAKELADETEALSPEEKALLKRSIDHLIRDTPETTLAAVRYKKLAAKAGADMSAALKGILSPLLPVNAKWALWHS